MTDTQTAPVSTPSTPVSAPPSEPPAKKPKRNPTPRQLEQLKNARQKRSEKQKQGNLHRLQEVMEQMSYLAV